MNQEMIKIIEGLEGQPTIYRTVSYMDANGLLSRKGQLLFGIMKYANSKNDKKE